jgi:hypothetical protein
MIVKIEPEAEAELEEAADRYEENVPGLGREFLAEMRRRTSRLEGDLNELAEDPHWIASRPTNVGMGGTLRGGPITESRPVC